MIENYHVSIGKRSLGFRLDFASNKFDVHRVKLNGFKYDQRAVNTPLWFYMRFHKKNHLPLVKHDKHFKTFNVDSGNFG